MTGDPADSPDPPDPANPAAPADPPIPADPANAADPPIPPDPVLWHDIECGSFSADLRVWRALADDTGGPVLELGAGTGRVALDLAREGHQVIAVERDPEIARALRERAAGVDGLSAVEADARTHSFDESFSLVIAPMQLIQMFDADDRARVLRRAAGHIRDGGLVGVSVVEPGSIGAGRAAEEAIPDFRESGGWVHSSRPLWVTTDDGRITVTRERRSVSPTGEVGRSIHRDVLRALDPAQLVREAAEAGLAELRRIPIRPSGEAPSVALVFGLV